MAIDYLNLCLSIIAFLSLFLFMCSGVFGMIYGFVLYTKFLIELAKKNRPK